MSGPSAEVLEDFLLSCRYGELDEVDSFVAAYGWGAVVSARDDRGNTVLHMCCGNGHVDILKYLLPHLPRDLFQQVNEAGSPPLHWAILNNHVEVVKILTELAEEQGGGLPLLHQKDRSGKDAFAQALFGGEGKEEVAGWIEGWLFKAEGGDEVELTDNPGVADGAGPEGAGSGGASGGQGEGVEVVANGDEAAEEEAVKELEEKTAGTRI